MKRHQLVELEDLDWCPAAVRDGGTDWLGFMANATGVFAAIAPKIRAAMTAAGTSEVLDLCSGGGGPWLSLERELAKSGSVHVQLSDYHPNLRAFEFIRDRSKGRIDFQTQSIDATNVPENLRGVRTMFNSFHHFPPAMAGAILADAVRKRCPIVIVEGVNSRMAGLVSLPFQIPAILIFTPFVRPFRWSRLLLTYVVPLIPLLVLFDGTMSFLRLYLEDELRTLVATVPAHETYSWDIGTARLASTRVGLLHLVGVPKGDASGAREEHGLH